MRLKRKTYYDRNSERSGRYKLSDDLAAIYVNAFKVRIELVIHIEYSRKKLS